MKTYDEQYRTIQRVKKIVLYEMENDDWPEEKQSLQELYTTLGDAGQTILRTKGLVNNIVENFSE